MNEKLFAAVMRPGLPAAYFDRPAARVHKSLRDCHGAVLYGILSR